jgi:hypothetical protein
MRGEWGHSQQQQMLTREKELQVRKIAEPARLAQLGARMDVVANYLAPPQRLKLQHNFDRVSGGGDPREIEKSLAQAEQQAQELMKTLASQRAVLEDLGKRLPGGAPFTAKDFVQGADGTLSLHARHKAGGRIPIVFVRTEAGTHHVRLEMDESGINTLVTPEGTLQGCAAQDEYVRRFTDNASAAGMQVSATGASAAPDQDAESRHRAAGQRP